MKDFLKDTREPNFGNSKIPNSLDSKGGACFLDDKGGFLESRDLLPHEQKDSHKNSIGTHDQLFIDNILMKEVKQRKKI